MTFDGTLAYFDHWRGSQHIGQPIEKMVERVKKWIKAGKRVKIFTARFSKPDYDEKVIQDWLVKCGIGHLPITNVKDQYMLETWDDQVVQVIPNTGERADGR